MEGRREPQHHQRGQRQGAVAQTHPCIPSGFAKHRRRQKLAKYAQVVLTNLFPYLTPTFIREHLRVLRGKVALNNDLHPRGLILCQDKLSAIAIDPPYNSLGVLFARFDQAGRGADQAEGEPNRGRVFREFEGIRPRTEWLTLLLVAEQRYDGIRRKDVSSVATRRKPSGTTFGPWVETHGYHHGVAAQRATVLRAGPPCWIFTEKTGRPQFGEFTILWSNNRPESQGGPRAVAVAPGQARTNVVQGQGSVRMIAEVVACASSPPANRSRSRVGIRKPWQPIPPVMRCWLTTGTLAAWKS